MSRFGYELPEDITEISDILDELVEKQPLARIRLKTKGEFQNVYVDKLMRSVSTDSDSIDEDSENESMVSDDEDLEEADDGSGDEVDDEPDDEPDDDSEEEPVEIGMRVIATTKKGEEPGEIIEIMESEGKCRVKLDSGRIVRIGVDKLESEPIQEPPKKARQSSKKRS